MAHPSTLARSHVRDSQVLIDKDPQASTKPLDMLSEWELVAKANEAVDKMVEKVSQGPTDLRAVGAKRLHNGGVVYKFDSPETATWLHKEKTAFVESFGGTSVVKEKVVTVLIEYVPVTHTPDALAENRKIKRDSKLEMETLLAMRWIKPEHRRAPGQCTAHIVTRFKMTATANHAICNGIVITGKWVWERCLCKEPRRCLKYQALNPNHLAAGCTQADRCGTCGVSTGQPSALRLGLTRCSA